MRGCTEATALTMAFRTARAPAEDAVKVDDASETRSSSALLNVVGRRTCFLAE